MLRKRNESPPWTFEEFKTLCDLLELERNPPRESPNPRYPVGGVPLKDLLSLGGFSYPERAQEAEKLEQLRIEREIALAHKRLAADPVYKKLRKNARFRELSRKFGNRIKNDRQAKWHPRAEFEFIFWVLLAAHLFFLEREKRMLKRSLNAYAGHRKSARRHIAALLKLRSIGNVQLIDFAEDRNLTSLLEKLDSELQIRKRRETAKTPATNAIALLARQLSVCFNMSAPTVLEDFDNWLELGINGTTIREIAANEKKKWDAELAIERKRTALVSGLRSFNVG